MEKEVTVEKTKLVEEIQDVLNSWLNEKSDVRSVASLSRATGVADSSIRRLLNSGIKIQDDSVFRLISHVFDIQTFEGISNSLVTKPETLKWFQKSYAYMKESAVLQQYKYSPTADVISENPISLSIYSLISESRKISPGYIKEQFGAIGDFELEKLLQKQVVFLEEDGSLRAKDSMLKLTKDQVVDNLPDLTRIFLKKDHDFNGRILDISSVSKQGYIKMMDAVDKFANEISQIEKDNPGDIPVITAGFLDTLTTAPYFEGGKNEKSN